LIGDLDLGELRPAHIQQAYARMTGSYKPATLRRLHAIVHHAFEDAVGWDLLDKNPAAHAHPPKEERITRTILSVDDARHLLADSRDSRWGPLWAVLATTGLRISEALALRWDDIVGERLTVRQGKTPAATREVPLVSEAAAALKRQKAAQNVRKMQNRDVWQENGLVFTSMMGAALTKSGAWRAFKRALERAELPDMRLHDLRRTAVAWMREAGIDADVVQVILGHANLSTTIDIYGSVNRARLEDAGRRLDAYLREEA
jgi:integrase